MKTAAERNRALAASYCVWLLEARNRSQETVYEYGQKLTRFLDHLGATPVACAQLSTLECWVKTPTRAAVLAPATKAHNVNVLRGFYRWLALQGELSGPNPCDGLFAPTVRNMQPKALDVDLWVKLWGSSALTEDERVLLGLGYFCGFRRSEICRLAPRHVEARRGMFVGFIRKGGGDDTFPYASAVALFAERAPEQIGDPDSFLGPLAAAAARSSAVLLPWGADPRSASTSEQATPNQVNKRLTRLLERLVVPRFTPHALRHSFVTRMLEMEVPLHVVSRLANHSSVDITMRYVKTAQDPLAAFLRSDEGIGPRSRWGR